MNHKNGYLSLLYMYDADHNTGSLRHICEKGELF